MRVPGLTLFFAFTLNISVGIVHAGSWFSIGEWGPSHWIREMCAWIGFCNEVCFQDLGCFTDELDCHKYFFPPMGPEEISTSFTLFTRKSNDPINGEPLQINNSTSLHRSTFRANKKTVFIIHGWGEHSSKPWIQNLRSAILRREKTNVIILDWYEGADELNYWKSVQNIRVVGIQLALFLTFLQEQTGMPESSVHLIGHSLGAHLAGYAGERFPRIGRITALDAAGPSFEDTEEACRLDKSDALFVDAVHTDSDGGAGILQPIGHRDFYPNGGGNQPGCNWWQLVCNHARANDYFIESLVNRNCGFRGVPCEDQRAFANGSCTDCGNTTCPRMGYFTEVGNHSLGKFILYTEGTSPFCAKRRKYERLHRKWASRHDKGRDDTSR